MNSELECDDLHEDEEGVELCLCCLAPVPDAANFCVECGAPLGFYAAALPYQRILAEGFVYRRALNEPKSLLVVIGVWILFGGYAVTGYWLLSLVRYEWARAESIFDYMAVATVAVPAAMLGVGVWAVLIASANYLKFRTSELGRLTNDSPD